MASHTMQCNVIIPEHTNKQDLTLKNHPEVVTNGFLAHLLCITARQLHTVANWKVSKSLDCISSYSTFVRA